MATINGDGGDNVLNDTIENDTINGEGGSDTIIVDDGGADTVNGGAGVGSDTLIIDYSAATRAVTTAAGPTPDTTGFQGRYTDGSGTRSVAYRNIENFQITTGSGNDIITTATGNDVVNTGEGDDLVDFGSGSDEGDGGVGEDGFSANLSAATAAISINLVTGVSGTFRNFEYLGTLQTGSGGDTIVTRSLTRNETILTNAGNDTITVAGGADTVNGGADTDTLIIDYSATTRAVTTAAGPTADTTGFQGTYSNGSGALSVAYRNIENFQITTGSGADNITTATGNDIVNTGAGNDFVNFGSGSDSGDGGADEDGFSADRSAATTAININLVTGASDTFANFEYLGTLQTGSGGDTIVTRNLVRNEVIQTNAGNDTITVAGGADTVNGGADTDTLIIDYSAATRAVTTAAGPTPDTTGFQGTYTDGSGALSVAYRNIENFQITTGSGNDIITTATGNDVVNTGEGDDLVDFGSGSDEGDGGVGEDGFSANLSAAAAAISINLVTGVSETFRNFEFLGTLQTGSGGDTIVTRNLVRNETILTNAGNDTITVAGGADTVNGGADTDTLIIDYSATTRAVTTAAGPTADATGFQGTYSNGSGALSVVYRNIENFQITTGSGADNITTATGNDIVNTGAGNDFVNFGSGSDSGDGGTDEDGFSADRSATTTAININLVTGASDTFANFEYIGTLQTGSGDDTIVTRSLDRDENVQTGAGDDTITVAGGADTVNGGAGAGSDTLIIDYSAATRAVTTAASPTADTTGFQGTYTDGSGALSVAYRNIENFQITTGSGNDIITAATGNDVVNTGAGNDFVDFGSGSDSGDGGADEDGFSADRSAAATAININLVTGASETFANFEYLGTLQTGSGDDTIVTRSLIRNENVQTGAGNDTIAVAGGADTVNGGADTDTLIIDYSATTRAVTTATGPTADATGFQGTYTDGSGALSVAYRNIENFQITTGSGADTITTASGNDLIDGGAGNDTLNGGAGTDTLSYASHGGTSGITVSLAVAAAQVTGAGTDTISNFENLIGSANADTLTGNDGDNVIDGGAGTSSDDMNGGAGIDTVSYASLTGGVGVTVDLGLQGDFVDTGGGGSDRLANFENVTGSANNDALAGDLGSNRLDGGAGDDVLTGRLGNDIIIGGDGTDIADYLSGAADGVVARSGDDRIITLGGADGTDTLTGVETIRFAGADNVNGTADDLVFTSVNGNFTVKAAADTGSATEAGGSANGTAAAAATGNVLANDINLDADATDSERVTQISWTDATGPGTGSGTSSAVTQGGSGTATGRYGNLSIGSDGTWTYTPDAARSELLDSGEVVTETFTYTVDDGSGNPVTSTITVTLTGTNDAPVVTDLATTVAFGEEAVNAAPRLIDPSVVLTDGDGQLANGTLTLSGGIVGDTLGIRNQGSDSGQIGVAGNSITFGGVVIGTFSGGSGTEALAITLNANATAAAVDALIQNLTFSNSNQTPTTTENQLAPVTSRTLTLAIADGASGSLAQNITINVQAENDAPSGADATLTIAEDAVLVLTEAMFGFSDIDGNSFKGVIISSAPTGGTLFFDADGAGGSAPAAVTSFPTQTYLAADLAAGKLTFVPTSNANGAGAASLRFTVVDNGGTSSAGDNTDTVPNTLTIDITAVNDAPVNTVPGSQTVAEDGTLTFSVGGGNPISVADVDVGSGTMRVVVSVADGVLTAVAATGATITANGSNSVTIEGSAAAINVALDGLTYAPPANANGSRPITVTTDDLGNTGGTALNDTDTIAVTVTPVNDAPTGGDASRTVAEDGSYTLRLSDFSPADPVENDPIAGVVITAVPPAAEGTLTLDGVTVTDGQFISTGDILANRLVFNPAADYFGPASFTFQVRDSGPSDAANFDQNTDQSPNTFSFTVSPVNDPPVLTTPFDAASIQENAPPTLIAAQATLTDDSANFAGGFLSVFFPSSDAGDATDELAIRSTGTGPGQISVDGSNVRFEGTIIGTIDSNGENGAALRITFNANATPAAVQELVRNITYASTSDNPPSGRLINLQLQESDGAFDVDSVRILIERVNDTPTVDLADSPYSATEQTPVSLKGTISLGDVDGFSNFATYTVTLSVGEGRIDVAVGASGAVVQSGTNGTKSVVITGSLDAINALLNTDGSSAVTYTADTDTPPASTTLTVTVNDGGTEGSGGAKIGSATQTIAITAVNDAPGLQTPFAGASIQENAPPTPFASQATVSDDGANFGGGFLSVFHPSSFSPGATTDQLGIRNVGTDAGQISVDGSNVRFGGTIIGTVSGGANGSNMLITFNANATPAAVQELVRNITYTSTSDNPGTQKFIDFQLDDGAGGFDVDRIQIDVTRVNDAPTATLASSSGATEQVALNLKGTITVGDVDGSSNSSGNTVTLSVPYGRIDVAVGTSGAVVQSGNGTGTVVITGSLDAINALLNTDGTSTISYTANTDAPPASTTLTVTVNDGGVQGSGGAQTGTATQTITIAAVNDAPTVSDAPDVSATEQTPVALFAGQTVSDPDLDARNGGAGDYAGSSFAVNRNSGANAEDLFSIVPGANFTILGDSLQSNGQTFATVLISATGFLVVNFTSSGTIATTALVQEVLQSIRYTNGSDTPPASVDLSYGFNDRGSSNNQGSGGDLLSGGLLTVTIAAVDDGGTPGPDTVTTDEATPVSGNLLGNDSDVDGGPAPTVSAVNGSSASVGQQIVLASGALLTVNADGTYSYDPNGAFNALSGPGAGGTNSSATDSFTYTLARGGTATVTITVNGLDSSGDQLNGTGGNDILFAGQGDDAVTGGEGEDHLDGGEGRDRLSGGGGRDYMFGGAQGDSAQGGSGGDIIFGESGEDELSGDDGDDYIDGGDDRDVISGGTGRDDLRGGGGHDSISGGADGDLLFGGDGEDDLRGDDGDDYLDGGNGRDYLFGGTGNDTVVGGVDANVLFGDAGEDFLFGGDGGDYLDGGDDRDVVFGGTGRDDLRGGAGNDSLEGGADGDLLFGGEGEDELRGGEGDDHAEGGAGRDYIFGDAGLDTLFGGEGSDVLSAGLGDDFAFGEAGEDHIEGGAGRDSLFGGAERDYLFGGADADVLLGGEGGDILFGDEGADQLFGEVGDDYLEGGEGDDLIVGGLGRDELIGGAGADTFAFTLASASGPDAPDLIIGFEAADRIDLGAIDADTGLDGNQAFTFIGDEAFSGAGASSAGQLRITGGGGGFQVEADTDGDGDADFVLLVDAAGLDSLTPDAFLL